MNRVWAVAVGGSPLHARLARCVPPRGWCSDSPPFPCGAAPFAVACARGRGAEGAATHVVAKSCFTQQAIQGGERGRPGETLCGADPKAEPTPKPLLPGLTRQC